jgi:hypothetical protein
MTFNMLSRISPSFPKLSLQHIKELNLLLISIFVFNSKRIKTCHCFWKQLVLQQYLHFELFNRSFLWSHPGNRVQAVSVRGTRVYCEEGAAAVFLITYSSPTLPPPNSLPAQPHYKWDENLAALSSSHPCSTPIWTKAIHSFGLISLRLMGH